MVDIRFARLILRQGDAAMNILRPVDERQVLLHGQFCLVVETDDHGARLIERHFPVTDSGGAPAEPLLIELPRALHICDAERDDTDPCVQRAQVS